jgi:hypothetical protein
MPQGVSYRGMTTAPAHAIVEQHRLDSWLEQDDYDDETDYSNVYYENGEYFNV